VTDSHRSRHIAFIAVMLCALASIRLAAHPTAVSYLNVVIGADGLSGRLVVHDLDAARELAVDDPARLADATFLQERSDALARLLQSRLHFVVDGRPASWSVQHIRAIADQNAIEIEWRAPSAGTAGKVTVSALLFPYDVNHQTLLNLYEGATLVRQEVLDRTRTSVDFFTGTRQGLFAVFTTFTASGIHHIAIGPDHILFIIGLLLLGGSLPRLLAIVTAFTLGHSVTLALATLQIVDPPARLIEPAIALSIVYVGADNLLSGGKGRDVRAWIALLFGLVHGFGFASVLRAAGLPNEALGVSLFSFNFGVEIGQAIIVIVVASALQVLRRRNAVLARHVATAGSVIVMLAGAFWFLQRVMP
jgi:hypothetical protein